MLNEDQRPSRRKRPSIKDVAERAGVSIATVSHVFSGKKRVKEDLAARVREAAKQLGYSVDRVASQLRTGRARVVGILVPDLEDLFLSQLVSRLEAQAQDDGYEVIVTCSRNDPDIELTRLRALFAWRPAGVIAAPCRDTLAQDLIDEYSATPIVGADRIHPSTVAFDTVTVDNYGSGVKAIEHLLGCGARSIALVAAKIDQFAIRERIRGATETAESAAATSLDVFEVGYDPAEGAAELCKRLKSKQLPSAFVGLTNMTTLAVLSAFAQIGVEAPRDTLLLGFHDSLWMTARRNPVTTMAQPVEDVANCAWDRLKLRMNGDTSPNRSTVFSAHLIERTSTDPKNCGALRDQPGPSTRV